MLSVVVIAAVIIAVGISIKNTDHPQSSEESSQTETTSSQTTASSKPVILPNDENKPIIIDQTEESALPPPQENENAEDIILLARSLIGTDFSDGGDSPQSGFDNSGFIYYVLRENGYITCPRGVSAQSNWGTQVTYSELSPGDLVFFSENGVSAEFGGIYAGDGIMIACLMPGTQVKEVNITTSYYADNFLHGVVIN